MQEHGGELGNQENQVPQAPAAPAPTPAPRQDVAGAVARPQKKGSGPWPLIILGLVLLVGLVVIAAVGFSSAAGAGGWGGAIAVIPVKGPIMGDGGGGLFGGPVGARQVMGWMKAAREDDSIKIVVLDINSPGGTAAASQALAEEVRKLAAEKPVIATIGEVGASGAYYVASQTDTIFASRSSVVGSIGVVGQTLRYYEAGEKYGFEGEAFVTGEYKDTGSPWRPMRDDEREYMQGLIDTMLEDFVGDVAEGRGDRLTLEEARELANGKVWAGVEARDLKLVDELGNYFDALDYAARQAGLGEDPMVIRYGPDRGIFGALGMKSVRQEVSAAVREELGGLGGLLPPQGVSLPMAIWDSGGMQVVAE